MITTQEKLETLRVALRRLETGEKRYICYALPDGLAGDHLRAFVEAQIQPFGTLTNWVANVSTDWPCGQRRARSVYFFDKIDPQLEVDTRIRFVKAMIRAVETGTEVQGDWA